jgi:hypothetical protein
LPPRQPAYDAGLVAGLVAGLLAGLVPVLLPSGRVDGPVAGPVAGAVAVAAAFRRGNSYPSTGSNAQNAAGIVTSNAFLTWL